MSGKNLGDQETAINSAVKFFSKLKEKNSDELKNMLCKLEAKDWDVVEKHVEVLRSISESVLDAIGDKVDKQKLLALLMASYPTSQKSDGKWYLENIKTKVEYLSVELNKLKEFAEVFDDKNKGYTVKVISAFKLIRSYSIASDSSGDDDDEKERKAQESINKIKRHVMFFAQIADAKNAETTKGILTAYTLPAISFFEKRDNSRHWFVSSYLGMSATVKDNDVSDDYEKSKIFASIGLEYSWGYLSMFMVDSISIMVAPFDFGYPVNLKLQGIEENVEFDEIIAPSI